MGSAASSANDIDWSRVLDLLEEAVRLGGDLDLPSEQMPAEFAARAREISALCDTRILEVRDELDVVGNSIGALPKRVPHRNQAPLSSRIGYLGGTDRLL